MGVVPALAIKHQASDKCLACERSRVSVTSHAARFETGSRANTYSSRAVLKDWLREAFDHPTSRYFGYTQALISLFTVASIGGLVLETVSELSEYHRLYVVVELATTAFFALEYACRLYSAENKPRYIFSAWGIADLLSIAPTILGIGNLQLLKSGRATSLLRLLRLTRTAKIVRLYLQTHKAHDERELEKTNMVIYFLALSIAIVSCGSVLYEIEGAQEAYANIPLGMLQAAKLLLGGLGAAPPLTWAGEIIEVLVRLLGLALFGLLISVVGNGLKRLLFEHA